VGFVFSHVHVVVVDAPVSRSSPPSSPSNIKNLKKDTKLFGG
jgi:hypothetical protein